MASGYVDRLGLDLDDVFSPLVLVEKAPDVGYHIDGVDISNRYLPLYAGTRTHVTGYRTSDADLNTIFGVFEGPTPSTSVRQTISVNPMLAAGQLFTFRQQTTIYAPGEPVTVLGDQSTASVFMALSSNDIATLCFVVVCLVDEVGNPLPQIAQPEEWDSMGYPGGVFGYQYLVDNGLSEGWSPALPPGAGLGLLTLGQGDFGTYTLTVAPVDDSEMVGSFNLRRARTQARIADATDQLDQTPLDGTPFIPPGVDTCVVSSNEFSAFTTSWVSSDAPIDNYATSAGEYTGWNFGANLSEWALSAIDLLGYLNDIVPEPGTVIGTVSDPNSDSPASEMKVIPTAAENTSGIDSIFEFLGNLTTFDATNTTYVIFPFYTTASAAAGINYRATTLCSVPSFVSFSAPQVVLDTAVEPPSDT